MRPLRNFRKRQSFDETLASLSYGLLGRRPRAQAFQEMLGAMQQYVGVAGAALGSVDEGHFQELSSLGLNNTQRKDLLERVQLLLVHEGRQNGRAAEYIYAPEGSRRAPTSDLLVIPLYGGSAELIGWLAGTATTGLDEQGLAAAKRLAGMAAAALESIRSLKRLQKLSVTDELTGCHNRWYFWEMLQRELDRSHRYRHALSLLLLDVNDFKFYNDRYGHLFGDTVLRRVGETLREVVRASDIVCRYGGDEFTVILPETARDGARQLMARLEQHVHAQRVAQGEANVSLSISVGMSSYPEDGDLPEALVERADQACYAAKPTGEAQQR